MIRAATDRILIRRLVTVRAQRSAFSLMELFLVIAILSAMMVISWPMLRRPLNKSVVQDAAQQLQRDLASARLKAVETGQIWIFQFRPGTIKYYIGTTDQRNGDRKDHSRAEPRSSAENSERKVPLLGPKDDTSIPGGFAADESLKELPFGTSFAAAPATITTETLPMEDWNSKDDESSQVRSDEPIDSELAPWSAPIRFYPSGRSNPASVSLRSEQGYVADVEVQGLAGRTKISAIRR